MVTMSRSQRYAFYRRHCKHDVIGSWLLSKAPLNRDVALALKKLGKEANKQSI